MSKLIEQLIEQKYLKSPQIIESFNKIKRADFLPKEIVKAKGEDFINQYNSPIPIGYNQTISQPLTVAFMLELLRPMKGDKILEIGSGSGWQTTMLSYIVKEEGFVYAIEKILELKDFGQNNLAKYNFKNVEFICDDGSKGLSNEAPFDKIIAAASAKEIPLAWKDQLRIGGRLVTPIKNSIWLLIKKGDNEFEEKEYPGFSFVPLVKE